MAEYNLPSNSLKAREIGVQESRVQKKVDATLKKKTKTERLLNDSKEAAKYVWANTIVPSILDIILNSVTNGLSMIFFKDGNHRASVVPTVGLRTDYSTRSRISGQPKALDVSIKPVFENPVLASIDQVSDVVNEMRAVIKKYKFATWADLYDICGIDTENWQGCQKYGWTSVDSARFSTTHTIDEKGNRVVAYELVMPKSSPIDDDKPF